MRGRVAIAFGLLSLAGLVRAVSGCTAYVLGNLPEMDGSAPTTVGDCFKLTANQCGQCIENSCENPTGSPPVSLKAVCNLDPYALIIGNAQQCSADPRKANYSCQEMYIDGGTYASSIADKNAAESNLQHCITDNCKTSCSECDIPVPTCQSETIHLPEAGTCGTCLDQAMNPPNSPCQSWVLKGGCYEDSSGAIARCAVPSGTCSTKDCSGLSNPSTSLVPETLGLYQCLWGQCQASCQ